MSLNQDRKEIVTPSRYVMSHQPLLRRLMRRSHQTILVCAVLIFSPAYGDAYLDALNNAAGDLELDPVSKGSSSEGASTQTSGNSAEDMPAGLSQDGFESFLQKRFFGSFAFYEKLDTERKSRVFEAYGGTPNIDDVRKQIKRQYLSQ